jgi:predicted dehydrogenase
MKKLGAAVIGLKMGEEHLAAYHIHPEVEVAAVCDTDSERLERIARTYKIKTTTTNYEELLGRDDIDVISVATPDHLHAEQAIKAMQHGKHVLCEKPMVPTLAECEQVIRATEKTKMKFMIGQVRRFSWNFSKAMKSILDSGELGELFYVESNYAHNYSKAEGVGGWRKSSKIIREPFLGGACHAVDFIRWIAGDVEEAFAYSNHKCLTDWPVDDCTIACFKFKNGMIGKVFLSIGCRMPYDHSWRVCGTKGTMMGDIEQENVKLYLHRIDGMSGFTEIPVVKQEAVVTLSGRKTHPPIVAEVNEFIDCVLGRKPLVMDAREGARTVAACLAAIESAKTGKAVKVQKL